MSCKATQPPVTINFPCGSESSRNSASEPPWNSVSGSQPSRNSTSHLCPVPASTFSYRKKMEERTGVVPPKRSFTQCQQK
ncbi:hypothetical protein ACROYT_G019037 [Oculina patagonica]